MKNRKKRKLNGKTDKEKWDEIIKGQREAERSIRKAYEGRNRIETLKNET